MSAPADFKHYTNPDGVWDFIYELRRQVFIKDRFRGLGSKNRPNLYISLDEIQDIDLEGALILAAELDRIRQVIHISAWINDAAWDPVVRAMLAGLGLYSVIEAKRYASAAPLEDITGELARRGLTIIPFLSCHRADPVKAKELRDQLVLHCEPSDEAQLAVYDALVEAFTNAVQHAYRKDVVRDGVPHVDRWWAGALVNKRTGTLDLIVYDQGAGIPETIKRRPWWSWIKGRKPELTDASVIEGALEYGRSGANADRHAEDSGRGNGLWRMCELTNFFEAAEVRVTSLNGNVTYMKDGRIEPTTLSTRFGGTMIAWCAKIAVPGSGNNVSR